MKKDKKWVKRGLAFLMSALICFHVGAVPVLANETTSNTVNETLLSQFEKDTSSNPSEEPEEPIPSEDTKDTSSELSSSEPSENPEEKQKHRKKVLYLLRTLKNRQIQKKTASQMKMKPWMRTKR